ncbi:hypothetical protein E2C01_063132 [Portunus trituberculatus]|uniref:Uncharacterized protein n=1 Tax=Portunus trituberculatus TaxID=210409 RepID=A0A5B7H8D9_PORTR|nr:hypothetical protein [Portunus trituberculatus]
MLTKHGPPPPPPSRRWEHNDCHFACASNPIKENRTKLTSGKKTTRHRHYFGNTLRALLGINQNYGYEAMFWIHNQNTLVMKRFFM